MTNKILNIEIRYAGQRIVCKHCDSMILMNEVVLTRSIYNKKRKWSIRHNYHPTCFIEEQLFYLGEIPKPNEARKHGKMGRPRLDLTDEERLERRRKQKRDSYYLTKARKCDTMNIQDIKVYSGGDSSPCTPSGEPVI